MNGWYACQRRRNVFHFCHAHKLLIYLLTYLVFSFLLFSLFFILIFEISDFPPLKRRTSPLSIYLSFLSFLNLKTRQMDAFIYIMIFREWGEYNTGRTDPDPEFPYFAFFYIYKRRGGDMHERKEIAFGFSEGKKENSVVFLLLWLRRSNNAPNARLNAVYSLARIK